MKKILIIGASNIDYFGMTDKAIIKKDSNIGTIKVSFGGVGRNICENLARLGANVTFITAIGNDELSKSMATALKELGVEIMAPEGIEFSSSYMAIHDSTGDMIFAINDMKAINKIDVEYLKSQHGLINQFDYVVCDGNLSEESISYIFDKYRDKGILVDGISATKVMKFKDYLANIYLLKCNIYEAQALVGKKLHGNELLSQLMHKGCKTVVVTDGVNDIYFSDGLQIFKSTVTPVKDIVNATGAGDSMFAGMVYKLIQEIDIQEAVEFGKEVSTVTLKSPKAVSEDVNALGIKNK